MHNFLFYPAGTNQATRCAQSILMKHGIHFADSPNQDVTHLLLDVPSSENQRLPLQEQLSESVTVIGGNLSHPCFAGHETIDLLKYEPYLCRNAAITAHCALTIALPQLKTTIPDSPTLIFGWGRIGKCLAAHLRALDAEVWLCIRNPKEAAMAEALGYHVIVPHQDVDHPEAIRLIFNTVPQMILPHDRAEKYRHAVKIDLASSPGIESNDVIIARGLPGRYAPESSGQLISRCILDLLKEE